ncbi:DUF3883 domain-containing protein [Polyangium sp. y55x31]|uniref:protein NO VEIN domain-containing protein n=1 Tax=Polyangium sp. y55x31 TaxID=3042688 RepID=UPI002482F52A|nr:DUF3883 domain-containing protein [Polyangium sp. y55x31]MDI1480409.1 DUF3883 domain-containing protein [Polyangium sp. y55x31]
MKVYEDDGMLLDATFHVEHDAGALALTFDSRGGTKGSSSARNIDYARGLLRLLERLRKSGAKIADALIDSRGAHGRPIEERRLLIPGRPYPLEIDDPQKLQRLLAEAQRKSGRPGWGNPTKRIRIVLAFSGSEPSVEDLERDLARPPGYRETLSVAAHALGSAVRGQGYESDPAIRHVIELHAMGLAEAHYQKLGFDVENTASMQPFDFRCTRDGLEVRVEVKGTRTGGETVDVTVAEVENARGTGWRTDLFIVHQVEVVRVDGVPVASGGMIRIIDGWKPLDAHLTPTRFRCVVPAAWPPT